MKKLLVFLIISLSSLLFINNVKADYLVDISEFTLPNGINTDDYYIVIGQNSNRYSLIVWDKSLNNRFFVYHNGTSSNAPYLTYEDYLGNYSSFYLSQNPYFENSPLAPASDTIYYRTSSLSSKVFDSSTRDNSYSGYAFYYLVYSNAIIYGRYSYSDLFYNPEWTNKKVPDLIEKNTLELENTQLFSYDIYINDSDLKNFYFNFNLIDNNNYENLNISKTDISGFKFYALINENNLKHWTLINDPTNFYIDYNDEDYINDSSGINFTGSAALDFSKIQNVEQIKLSIELNNALNYEINYSDSIENSNTEYDYNYLGSDYSYLLNNYETNKYIIFSTFENKISGNIFIKSPNSTVYADYYNTENANFDSWGTTEFFKKINNDNYYIFSYENIGLTEKRSFYVTNNTNDNFEYYVYILPNIYYSYNKNKNMNDSIYINNEGSIINGNIETYYHDTNINNLFDYLNNNNNLVYVFQPIKTIWSLFHRGKIYTYLMIIIVTSIIILIVKSISKN